MSKMKLRVYYLRYVHHDEEKPGYAWELRSARGRNPIVIYGRIGFKTTKAARDDAHATAFRHNISIAKREDIRP